MNDKNDKRSAKLIKTLLVESGCARECVCLFKCKKKKNVNLQPYKIHSTKPPHEFVYHIFGALG